MTKDVTGHAIDQERPYLLLFMAALGVTGCVVLLAGTVIAPFYVPNHDWIADTISDLAAGQSEIFMDVALYGFAASLMAIALAASHAHMGGVFWSVGVLSFAILAALVVIIGARNEYGDGDTDGVVIHIYLVYGLGVFFALAPFCMAKGIKATADWASRSLIGSGILWVLSAPIFFFLPTGIDGLYERLLGVIACAIVLILSAVFWQRGKAALRT